jgi:ribosomal-protein-alanine acetyltransferase
MIFRLGTKEDIPLLENAIERIPTLTKEDVLLYLNCPYRLLYVLEDENKPVGFLSLTLEGAEAELDDIAILEENEGKGYGQFLLKSALEDLKRKEIQTLFLEVRKSNVKAIRLYENNGFLSYRERKNYYLSPIEDAVCYRKELFS